MPAANQFSDTVVTIHVRLQIRIVCDWKIMTFPDVTPLNLLYKYHHSRDICYLHDTLKWRKMIL
jgi:hypothetical protein